MEKVSLVYLRYDVDVAIVELLKKKFMTRA